MAAPAPASVAAPGTSAQGGRRPPTAAAIDWVASQGLLAARTETTWAQYRACMTAGSCTEPRRDTSYGKASSDHPVVGVSWEQAGRFCRFAGGRLPTLQEWTRLATNGSTAYPWGDDDIDGTRLNLCDARCDDDGRTQEIDDGHAGASPVCAFAAGNNADGVCDLMGNVAEWTSTTTTETDGVLAQVGGGSFRDPAGFHDPARKARLYTTVQNGNVGFRCVR